MYNAMALRMHALLQELAAARAALGVTSAPGRPHEWHCKRHINYMYDCTSLLARAAHMHDCNYTGLIQDCIITCTVVHVQYR